MNYVMRYNSSHDPLEVGNSNTHFSLSVLNYNQEGKKTSMVQYKLVYILKTEQAFIDKKNYGCFKI